MELPEAGDFSIQLAQENFTEALQRIPATPGLLASRQLPLSMGEIRMRQRQLGGLCWLATASRPDICARPAQLASRPAI